MAISRRKFITLSTTVIALSALKSCTSAAAKKPFIKRKKSYAAIAHKLRNGESSQQSHIEDIKCNIVIVGGGVSGLSAAYHLEKAGIKDIHLLELGQTLGGNSAAGENTYSKYPYGAHYLTLPNLNNAPLLSFLHDVDIITAFDAEGLPNYDETALCFDPEERLLIRGIFQTGLLPNYGLSENDKQQIANFFSLISVYKEKKGFDEKYFFEIPRSNASSDTALDFLDETTFELFLKQQNFNSEALLWYLDYCCKDDFGAGISTVSAWAGILYFASHRAKASNTDPSRVLTWPEGNQRLVDLLHNTLSVSTHLNSFVESVNAENSGAEIVALNHATNKKTRYTCNYCIVATPIHVSKHLLKNNTCFDFSLAAELKNSTWLVAAVTVHDVPKGNGTALCWDNVGYQTKSLGYIYNQHQGLQQQVAKKVLSLYYPVISENGISARKTIEAYTDDQWQKIIVEELQLLHPGIASQIVEIDYCIWGHGMIVPTVGLHKNKTLQKLSSCFKNVVFLAHSDLSGYSIFEEAFDQGYQVAEAIIKQAK